MRPRKFCSRSNMPDRNLVVDTCVALSAGNKSEAPQSRYSRDALYAIRDYPGHKLVFNAALSREWKNRAGRLAIQFLTYMVQHRRVLYVSDEAFKGVMRGCEHHFADENEKAAFAKDSHVVSAALASDRIIISNEVRLRAQLIQVTYRHPAITAIVWANPSLEGEDCAKWILAGAPSGSRAIE